MMVYMAREACSSKALKAINPSNQPKSLADNTFAENKMMTDLRININ